MITSDNELLGLYVGNSDQAAFEQLVRRHSSMVLSVCQNILWNKADSEDVFQSVFLLLSRKAPKLLKHNSVGGWLHETAVRTSLRHRRNIQRKREVIMSDDPEIHGREPWQTITANQQGELLHREIARLPKKYRDVIVLCHLEGKSRSQAANTLDCTTASVKAALARGRKLLRQRLVKHGVAASSAFGVASLQVTANAESTGCCEALIQSTIQNCQGLVPDLGVGTGTNVVQSLAQKELATMSIGIVQSSLMSAAGIVAVCTLSMAAFGNQLLEGEASALTFVPIATVVQEPSADVDLLPDSTPFMDWRLESQPNQKVLEDGFFGVDTKYFNLLESDQATSDGEHQELIWSATPTEPLTEGRAEKAQRESTRIQLKAQLQSLLLTLAENQRQFGSDHPSTKLLEHRIELLKSDWRQWQVQVEQPDLAVQSLDDVTKIVQQRQLQELTFELRELDEKRLPFFGDIPYISRLFKNVSAPESNLLKALVELHSQFDEAKERLGRNHPNAIDLEKQLRSFQEKGVPLSGTEKTATETWKQYVTKLANKGFFTNDQVAKWENDSEVIEWKAIRPYGPGEFAKGFEPQEKDVLKQRELTLTLEIPLRGSLPENATFDGVLVTANFDLVDQLIRENGKRTVEVHSRRQQMQIQKIMSIKPKQSDADVETPTKLEFLEKRQISGEISGFEISDVDGDVIRRFLDLNGDNSLDTWIYFKDGVETYRDVDLDFNRKADQYQYTNGDVVKFGIDPNEDGIIDRWEQKRLSDIKR